MKEAPAPRRIALGLAYDGEAWSGWQAQRSPALPTVQEALEAALSAVADHPVTTVCAGRTDAGVHATAQVVHFDTEAPRRSEAWLRGTNSLLPSSIAVQWAREVPAEFHARFSALRRGYRYLVLNRAQRAPLLAGRVCLERRALDAQCMQGAAQCLLGEQDFSAFRGAGCQSRTAMRRVDSLEVRRDGELVVIDICANAFLLHMVRNIVGALLRIGSGAESAAWLAALLASRDRRLGAATAPAAGLYLTRVDYAPNWGLPAVRPMLHLPG
jgi:tRNA pseudouridine38-40 synthase